VTAESSDDDQLTIEDLFLAVDFERLDCDLIANAIRSAKAHDDVAVFMMELRQLLEQASHGALSELLALVASADEANSEARQSKRELRDEVAKVLGAAAREAGIIDAEDLGLIAGLRAMGAEWEEWADRFEACACKEDAERVRFMLEIWVADTDDIRQLRAQAAARGRIACREEDAQRIRELLDDGEAAQ
jgi:hypothetical protein